MKRTTLVRKWMLVIGVIALVGAWSGTGLADGSNEAENEVTITVDEVAELDVEGTVATFEVGSDDDAGKPFKVNPTNEAANYLHYTSIVASDETRKITVKQTETLPAGVTLKVMPTAAGGNKQGDVGSVVESAITLNDAGETAADVVTGIGSCYTGNAESDGVKLAYALTVEPNDVADLKTLTQTSYTVTYTLTGSSN